MAALGTRLLVEDNVGRNAAAESQKPRSAVGRAISCARVPGRDCPASSRISCGVTSGSQFQRTVALEEFLDVCFGRVGHQHLDFESLVLDAHLLARDVGS